MKKLFKADADGELVLFMIADSLNEAIEMANEKAKEFENLDGDFFQFDEQTVFEIEVEGKESQILDVFTVERFV